MWYLTVYPYGITPLPKSESKRNMVWLWDHMQKNHCRQNYCQKCVWVGGIEGKWIVHVGSVKCDWKFALHCLSQWFCFASKYNSHFFLLFVGILHQTLHTAYVLRTIYASQKAKNQPQKVKANGIFNVLIAIRKAIECVKWIFHWNPIIHIRQFDICHFVVFFFRMINSTMEIVEPFCHSDKFNFTKMPYWYGNLIVFFFGILIEMFYFFGDPPKNQSNSRYSKCHPWIQCTNLRQYKQSVNNIYIHFDMCVICSFYLNAIALLLKCALWYKHKKKLKRLNWNTRHHHTQKEMTGMHKVNPFKHHWHQIKVLLPFLCDGDWWHQSHW